MSAFLGKIHYWLYGKIILHENLIENIIEVAGKNGYNSENLLKESYSKYGLPVTGSLENEIEHSNIHGWLQERIISVESRLAYVVTELLKTNAAQKEDIAEVFYKNGANAMKNLGSVDGTPQDFFNLVFDHMLEGMPCDRVNKIIENNDNLIKWEITSDLHKTFWDECSGDINNYHYFRTSWINGFLNESSANYKYVKSEDGINIIGEV